jgi:cell filamentation protein
MIPGDKAYYQGTDVLQNKLEVRDAQLATALEYKFANAREIQLAESPIQGNFDFKHLKEIHAHIFQDMYEWAGQTRELDFAKRSKETGMVSRFTPVNEMDRKAQDFDRFLQDKDHLKGLNKAEFVKAFAEVHTKLNEIHPFREGNGRSTRIFLTQLAKEAGYELDMTKLDKDSWNLASHKAQVQHDPRNAAPSIPGSQEPIKAVFNASLKPTLDHAFQFEHRDVALRQFPALSTAYDCIDNIKALTDKLGDRAKADTLNANAKAGVINKLRAERMGLPPAPDINPFGQHDVIKTTVSEVLRKQGFTADQAAAAGQKLVDRSQLLAAKPKDLGLVR